VKALDKKPDLTKSDAYQAEPEHLVSNTTAERPVRSVRPERVERPERPVRPVRVEQFERVEHPEQPVRLSGGVEQSGKREIRRHAFEFYRDQVTSLQLLRFKMMKTGRDTSMSAMVREALDDFIKKQQ